MRFTSADAAAVLAVLRPHVTDERSFEAEITDYGWILNVSVTVKVGIDQYRGMVVANLNDLPTKRVFSMLGHDDYMLAFQQSALLSLLRHANRAFTPYSPKQKD